MKYREFAGKKASVIALGCDSFGGSRDPAQTAEFLDHYTEAGGNFLDTARIYGGFRSESYIGMWLSKRHDRDELIIGTKGGHPAFNTMHIGRLDRASLTDDFERSIDSLGTYADIYWLHRDDKSREVGDILETLNGFYESGKARSFGVSNWDPERIAEANEYAAAHSLVGFAANQPQFSLAAKHVEHDTTMRHMDDKAYSFHLKTGMPCVPYSPQAKGFFNKLDTLGPDNLPGGLKHDFCNEENIEIFKKLQKLRDETGCSIAQLGVIYLLCQPFDTYPIVGASSFEQLDETLSCADAELDRDSVLELRSWNV